MPETIHQEINGVIEALQELATDNTIPNGVRTKITTIISSLKDKNIDIAIRINKVQDELETITNDSNIPSYTRTQLWNVSSMLEFIQ
ncbi:MAG: UPF0147 family protein [Candidatus Woesearchaeota archaeon]